MRHLNIDIETYSSIDIQKCGMYKYAQSPDFEVLLFAYAEDFGEARVIDLKQGEKIPDRILIALFDEQVIKHAYNAAFEWYCLCRYLSVKNPDRWLKQWRCTMVHGLYCGYTAGLEAAGKALGLPEDKRKASTGKALIKIFCTPCIPSKANGNRTRTLPWHEPEKWELFKMYNSQDVVTEMEIEKRLINFPVPQEIQAQWITDMRINALGVELDTKLIEGALYLAETETARLIKEAQALTGLENPNSNQQLMEWLERGGVHTEDLQKQTVSDLLKTPLPADVHRILEIRQELSKTSNKKYNAMEACKCGDGRARGLLQFYGANRTGRWGGRFIQPQNLPRTYISGDMLPFARELVKNKKTDNLKMVFGSVQDTLSQLIRTALVAKDGFVFVDADFSAIEARVIAWLAGEQWRLDVFNSHGKIYEASASQMFGVPIERIKKGNPEYALRQKGKVAELALGYQGSAGALINMGALKMGLSEEELPDIVSRWRASNKRIVDLWYKVQGAAIQAIQTGRPAAVNGIVFSREADMANNLDFLTVTLPSGRKLYYAKPHLGVNRWGSESIHYFGMDQTTKKWGSVDTYGGKLVENIVQAIARDCLADKIEALMASGFHIVFHVHDEVVIEVPERDADLETVCRIMRTPIPWAPGLPLNADGYISKFFKKD